MQEKHFSFKVARLTVLLSCLCTGCAIAESNTAAEEQNGVTAEQAGGLAESNSTSETLSNNDNENIVVDLATQQMELEKQAEEARLEAERKAEEERIALEKQALAEAKLTEVIGMQELQFRSEVAKIYADNDYALLWKNQEAKKQFLREYALVVASGISARTAKSLEAISNADENNNPLYDILITDAFLDYMYYTANVSHLAQNWLYSSNRYKAAKASELQIEQWLSAVKNDDVLSFINHISSSNNLYRQTVDGFISLLTEPTEELAIDNGQNKKKKKQKKQEPLVNLYKLAINVQRLRVIPNFDNGIFVNIPSYQLNYYRDGQLVLNSRVIVGKNERRTPVMYSKLSNVVVNPPWNAPPRLINEDIIPKVRQDPEYLSRNGYSIIDRSGKVVSPYSIDWGSIGAKFPYRLRQAAGDNSALGRYKFNMPSSDAIYLHDTPKRSLFGKKNRALSSGCVRVEKSDELATILLKEAGWSADRKQRVLDSRKTTSANIQSDNPVYLYYVTAWVDNGKTHMLPDIYGYDRAQNLSYVNWDVIRKYLL